MPLQEERFEETRKKIEQEKSLRKVNILKTVPTKPVILAIAGLAFFYWMYQSQRIERDTLIWLAVVTGVVIFVLSQKSQEESGLLTEQEAKDILYSKLKHKQTYTNEFPDGNIRIHPENIEPKIDYGDGFRAYKRRIGFSITDRRTGYKREYVAEVNVRRDDRPGDIIAIEEAPQGFDGKQIKDTKYIWGKDLMLDMMYTKERRK